MAADKDGQPVSVSVRNVGGIDDCSVEVSHGITVLAGPNATNRTSFLSALADALGGSIGRLRDSAEEGFVELTIGETVYRRTYRRTGEHVANDGAPLCDDTTLVDLYVALLGDNEARRAVEMGTGLKDVIMAPVDTADIEAQISAVEDERADVEARLESIERKIDRVPALVERRKELAGELGTLEEELDAVRDRLDGIQIDEQRASEGEQLLETLEGRREQLATIEENFDVQRTSITALEDERETIETELSGEVVSRERIESVESRLSDLRKRERSLAETIEDLTAIAEFNDDVLAGETTPFDAEQSLTAALDPDSETLECWTCGSTIRRSTVRDRLGEIRALIRRKREERAALRETIETVTQRRDELRAGRDRQTQRRERIEEIEAEIARRRDRIERLEERRSEVESEIEAIERTVEETRTADQDLLETHQELAEVQYQRDQVESELDDVSDEIDRLTSLREEREELQDRREKLVDQLRELRSRVGTIEREAVEVFNDQMDLLLEVLEYGNVQRLWIERLLGDGTSDRAESFELHVVRSDDGEVYESDLATLSESEREVAGLVLALSGYIVHEVYETVPFLLVDSIEEIDADRISRLLDYFEQYAEYLVVALLPEDADALDRPHDRISADRLGS
ncbi:MAG: archaea-specific SMC-related protein [archaeon]